MSVLPRSNVTLTNNDLSCQQGACGGAAAASADCSDTKYALENSKNLNLDTKYDSTADKSNLKYSLLAGDAATANEYA